MTQILINDDCLDYLQTIPPGSVDCLVTDPPYGYSFMGKNWDKAVPSVEVWKECLRVLKPGAFAFVMSAPRQDVLSQMIVRLTDAGFKTDFTSIYWTYASGFPKAMNIGKMVDKRGGVSVSWFGEWLKDWRKKSGIAQKDIAALFPSKTGGLTGCAANWELGLNIPTPEQFTKICRHFNLPFESIEAAEREVVGKNPNGFGRNTGSSLTHELEAHPDLTIPKTDAAKALNGSYGGFQPKPAVEVILVCMKPLSEKTYVDQALKNGKGVTWLDKARIPTAERPTGSGSRASWRKTEGRDDIPDATANATPPSGRFPANLLISDSVLDTVRCVCDTQEDTTPTAGSTSRRGELGTGEKAKPTVTHSPTDDPEATRPSKGLQTLSEESRNPTPTRKPFPSQDSPSTTNEDASPSVEEIVMGDTESGCGLSENGTETDASCADRPKNSTSTTSNLSPSTQNSDTKCPMGASCAHLATGKHQPTGSNQHFSRFFSLDAWAKTLPFLIVAKASKREKNEGLEGFEEKVGVATYGEYAGTEEHTTNTTNTTKNTHACVKPLTLMSYLITLGSRPGDTVLDPFLGSGTTALAAKSLNRGYIGIEKDASYYEIAKARLNKP